MSSTELDTQNGTRMDALNEDEIDLGEYIATLIDARWLIAAIAGIVLAIGVVYALVATPIYRGDALLQVEDKKGGMGLGELSAMFAEETPTETEIEIIRSRSVVGAAIDQLALDITVKPRYFPFIGKTLARRHQGDEPAQPWWGFGGYAWGGERVQVQRLNLPRIYEEEGEPLVLVAREAGRYELIGPDGELLLKGQVGQAAKSEGAPNQGVEIFVPELHAAPGARFELIKQSRAEAITDLQQDLRVSQKGKKTNVLQLALEGPDPKLVGAILDAIANAYLRQNVERRSAEAEKTLEFLNKQLPELKANLDADETRLNAYRSRLGSVDINLETKAVIEKSAEIAKALSELELKRAELREKFTESHPSLVTLRQKKEQLESQREALNRQIKSMPDEVQESVQLTRDVTVSNELYLLLLNKAQEMNVVKAGTVGNVRILDTAFVPSRPIKPKKAQIAALSLLLGLMLGVIVALVRKSLNHGLEDPDLVERKFGIPVYASIPHSQKQDTLVVHGKKSEKYTKLLGLDDPKDLAIESLRSLRTSMQFALLDAKNNVVAISGPSPGIGKSFVSANLAYVVADSGKRTLLIDGDMRKGHLHEYFGMQRTNGLSGVISGEVSLGAAIHETSVPNLQFIPAGIVPPNPSELLMTERFKSTIEALAQQFDLIIIDTPPVLAVTDAAIIGRLAGTHFITMKSGLHPAREIEQTLKRLNQNGIKPQGFIFNNVLIRAPGYGLGQYGKYGYHYQYEYK
jgi:tyrosine-protein kinase Etk/Wzc